MLGKILLVLLVLVLLPVWLPVLLVGFVAGGVLLVAGYGVLLFLSAFILLVDR